MIEEGSQEQVNDDADETEQGNSGAEGVATEGNDGVTEEQLASIAQRKAAQKEKRSKKRNDRPVDAEEDQPVRATKRKKTVVKRKAADTHQGNTSEPNTDNTSIAQPSTVQTSTAQPSKQPSPIDFTKPISVVLPTPQSSSSSSSSSEGTLSDSSIDSTEVLAEFDKLEKEKEKKKKPVKKTQFKRTTKRTTKQPIHISSDEEPLIVIDTTILEQPPNTSSILDHLTQHLSGDAFTHSNPNSPPPFPFVNTTTDQPIQEPPAQTIQTPPPSLDDIA
jgi:hypothetical protein